MADAPLGTMMRWTKSMKWAEMSPNMGKAANTIRMTVSSGTSASSVVNVRLPAVCRMLASLKRCETKRRKRQGVLHHKRCRKLCRLLLCGAFKWKNPPPQGQT